MVDEQPSKMTAAAGEPPATTDRFGEILLFSRLNSVWLILAGGVFGLVVTACCAKAVKGSTETSP